MEFTTSRLRVRSFAREDEEALHRLLSDPAVMRWMEPPYSPVQTRAFLFRAGLCQPPLVYAAESLSTNCIIGYVIYHPYIQPSDYEIGWALAPCHWGKGLATELTAALLDQARRQGARRAVLECVPQNTAVQRIAARFGFTFQGIEEGLEQYSLPL